MQQAWQRARQDVVGYRRRLLAERLVCYTAGNISVRIPGESDLLAITPASVPYDSMQPEDVCIVTTRGEIVEARSEPTSELLMHALSL